MNDVHNEKGTNKSLSLFFKSSFIVSVVIIVISSILLYFTFTFDIVPPILNRGIQPATFPKALLILIITLTLLTYLISLKKPWKNEKKLPNSFYITLLSFVVFITVSKFLDFFLGIALLSIIVSYFWGERRVTYLIMVSIIFPLIVFVFFETILGLRFPPGIITNLYYG
ncbi:tripartite tricarboxylate transporter TctB family protein [Candidatus Pelagibacter sp.]|nr:tripartite tricarboxylate transporter TctB family protein [Candidatus Pelagibacter sp.]